MSLLLHIDSIKRQWYVEKLFWAGKASFHKHIILDWIQEQQVTYTYTQNHQAGRLQHRNPNFQSIFHLTEILI